MTRNYVLATTIRSSYKVNPKEDLVLGDSSNNITLTLPKASKVARFKRVLISNRNPRGQITVISGQSKIRLTSQFDRVEFANDRVRAKKNFRSKWLLVGDGRADKLPHTFIVQ